MAYWTAWIHLESYTTPSVFACKTVISVFVKLYKSAFLMSPKKWHKLKPQNTQLCSAAKFSIIWVNIIELLVSSVLNFMRKKPASIREFLKEVPKLLIISLSRKSHFTKYTCCNFEKNVYFFIIMLLAKLQHCWVRLYGKTVSWPGRY